MTDDYRPDGFDRLLEWEHRSHMTAVLKQSALLQRLNKAEILCLARHFKLKNPEWYAEAGDWKYGGKIDLCNEIAEIMVGDGP